MTKTEGSKSQAINPETQPQPPLLSKRQAARRIGICPHTLARWVRQGKIKPIRFNSRMLRFDARDVENLISLARG